jgi:hypothetical protein
MIPNKVTEASLMFLVILLVLSPPPLNQPPSTSNPITHHPSQKSLQNTQPSSPVSVMQL